MIELMILATIGAIIHLLFKWNNSRKRVGVKFNWSSQIITTLIGLITVYVLIYVREDLKELVHITRINAVLLGYIGDSAFKNFVKTFKTKLTIHD